MKREAAIEALWKAKREYRDCFMFATLLEPVEMVEIDQTTYPHKETKHTASAGTRVIVTMISRFGDVGIRDGDLTPQHGYTARVTPDKLTDWSF